MPVREPLPCSSGRHRHPNPRRRSQRASRASTRQGGRAHTPHRAYADSLTRRPPVPQAAFGTVRLAEPPGRLWYTAGEEHKQKRTAGVTSLSQVRHSPSSLLHTRNPPYRHRTDAQSGSGGSPSFSEQAELWAERLPIVSRECPYSTEPERPNTCRIYATDVRKAARVGAAAKGRSQNTAADGEA